ncbi:MAG: hypothetical protein ABSF75_01460 [Terracidiphilus sp.]
MPREATADNLKAHALSVDKGKRDANEIHRNDRFAGPHHNSDPAAPQAWLDKANEGYPPGG